MPLSPLAQYYIRKLFRQNTDALTQLFMPNSSGLSESSLDRVLYQLSFKPESQGIEITELELLIKLYQQYENTSANATSLISIKRRILQILGFQTSTAISNKLPPIIEINSIEQFCFFFNGRIQTGIHYKNEIFGAVQTFTFTHRLQAYQAAWALLEAKVPTVLTIAPSEFVIWINLKSSVYPVLLRQDADFLRTLLILTSALCKRKFLLKKPSSKLQNLSKNRIDL